VLTLCLFDVSFEDIAGFLISIWVRDPLLKAAVLPFSSVLMLPVIHGFWLGYVRTVIMGTTSSMHLLLKPVTDVVYSMPLEEFRNIFQCDTVTLLFLCAGVK
jgi:hypothetical protein